MNKSLLLLFLVLAGTWVSGQVSMQRQRTEPPIGLVAYYPFNGNADDASGNGNNGSLMNGALFENDRDNNVNQAVRFDKSLSQYVNVANSASLQIDNAISFSFWLKRNSLGGQDQVLNKGGDWPNGTCNYGLVFSDWTLVFIYNGGYYYVDSPGVPQDNNWHHYAVTALNGTTEVHFYVDGVEKTSIFGQMGNPVINLYAQSTVDLHISGTNYFSNNTLDELRIYNRILTKNEIQSLYTNLVAYFPFNGNANDESGNGNHGTITGAQVTPAADRYNEGNKAFKFWFPDYVSVPTNPSFFTDEFTVSYWYKVEAYWGDRCILSCVGRNGGYQQPFSGTTFQYLFGYNFPTNSWFWTNYTVPNSPNTWQHITTTYKKTGDNASISKLYINGELKSSDTYANSIAYPGSEVFYIGRNHSDLGLNGELDDVRFYNKTLSDQEIKNLYLAEAKPVLQQPANQSSVNSPTPEMRWISPQADAEFIFQLAADSLFGTILYEQQTSAFSIQLPASLITGEKNFYWRVCSKLNEVTGPWSAKWSFSFVNTGLAAQKNLLPFLHIYPNPANTAANITMCFPENFIKKGTVTFEFINSIGKCVKKLTCNNIKPGNQEIEIETISLPSGIYYVKTDFGLSTQKLVIQH